MKNIPSLIVALCISAIALGIMLAIQFHAYYVHPLDEARGVLVQVQSTSDPKTMQSELATVKRLLPASGNPVVIFPTGDTDFGIMQNDLQTMLGAVDNVAYVPSWSSGFHTGMLNVHAQAATLVFNIIDATPYMYISLPYAFANALWLLGILELIRHTGIKKK